VGGIGVEGGGGRRRKDVKEAIKDGLGAKGEEK